mmetsp:Transcript_95211/g.208232  ORF Transcript_95211/g.208232 Transcript_95211/m.208232 type:complete len:80 (+) Transcript_95211:1-240(+)
MYHRIAHTQPKKQGKFRAQIRKMAQRLSRMRLGWLPELSENFADSLREAEASWTSESRPPSLIGIIISCEQPSFERSRI